MYVSQAKKIWLDYHRAHSKHNTIRAQEFTIAKFDQNFSNLSLTEVSNEFGDWRDTLSEDEVAAFFYLVFMVNFEYLKIFIKW